MVTEWKLFFLCVKTVGMTSTEGLLVGNLKTDKLLKLPEGA